MQKRGFMMGKQISGTDLRKNRVLGKIAVWSLILVLSLWTSFELLYMKVYVWKRGFKYLGMNY